VKTQNDTIQAKTTAQVLQPIHAAQRLSWKAHVRVDKWDPDTTEWAKARSGLKKPSGAELALIVPPDDVLEVEHNLLCNNGIQRLEDLLIGIGSIVAYTNTTARIATGNGVGTAAAADTDMSASAGSTNRWFNVMDATFPSRAAQTITFKSTFASADGNYAWNEWGIDGGGAASAVVGVNDATHAALLNHKTSAALGTKASGATWAFTATLVIS
jgi:hypothetical protein